MKIEFLNMNTGKIEVITSIEDHPSLYNNSLVFKRDDGRSFGGQHLCLPIFTVIYYKEEKIKVKKLLDSGYILAENGKIYDPREVKINTRGSRCPKEEKHYYIRGNKKHPELVIDKLKSLGAKDTKDRSFVNEDYVFFIDPMRDVISFAAINSIWGQLIIEHWEEIEIEEPDPETVTFTVQKRQTNCDDCKFKSLCYDANIELVHLLKCNVYDLNSITEVERQK